MRDVWNWAKGRHRMTMATAVILIILWSMLIMYGTLFLAPVEPYIITSLIGWSHGLMPFLNWLPIFFSMLLLYFATGNPFGAIMPVSFVAVVMAVVNRIKLQMRGDPLLHWDIAQAKEALTVFRAFNMGLILMAVVAAVLFILLTVFLCRHFVSRRIPAATRIVGTLCTAVAMVVLNATVYSNASIEKSLPTWGSFYNLADVHNSKGNLYSFLYNWNTTRDSTPDGYDEETVRHFMTAYAQEHPQGDESRTGTNVIMIMGEAFSAISESDALDFAGYRNPLETFSAMSAEGIAGSIVVPSRGGGTSDTEFEVLTAQSSKLVRSAPYAYRTITGEMLSLPAVFRQAGYANLAMHPGDRWFYNRQNVYPLLGFDSAVFEDAFPEGSYLDTFISEEATYDMLLSMVDGHSSEASGQPLFLFCVTIQNHAAYYNRYLPEGTHNFTPKVPMTEEEQNILSNYFAGVIDADQELERLAAYLQGLDEPFVVVYFGDHLPSLDESLYDLLMPPEKAQTQMVSDTRLYQTPFLIWQNDASRAQGDLRDTQAGQDTQGQTMSANYLGAYLLQLLGMDDVDAFFCYTNEVRAQVPVMTANTLYAPDGSQVSAMDEQRNALFTLYRDWAYYRNTQH